MKQAESDTSLVRLLGHDITFSALDADDNMLI